MYFNGFGVVYLICHFAMDFIRLFSQLDEVD